MTPTLEQRKAAAYDTMPTRGYETYEAWAYDNFDLIHELLAPSPQAPDNEVDAAFWKSAYHTNSKLLKDSEEVIKSLNVALHEAQQPRQEWLKPDKADKYDQVPKVLINEHDGKQYAHIAQLKNGKWYEQHCEEDGYIFNPILFTEVPITPKDKSK